MREPAVITPPRRGVARTASRLTAPRARYNRARRGGGPLSRQKTINAGGLPPCPTPANDRTRPHPENEFPPGSVLGFLADRSQLDFEVEFFQKVLAQAPYFTEVLRVQAGNLTTKGRLQDGLAVDKQLVAARPADPTAHYNLACRYALLKQPDLAFVLAAQGDRARLPRLPLHGRGPRPRLDPQGPAVPRAGEGVPSEECDCRLSDA